MNLSTVILVLALIGVVAVYLRLVRLDVQRVRVAPIQWIYCAVGHGLLGVGLVTRAVAEYINSSDLKQNAAVLTLAGIVMVLTRSRRSKMQ